MLTLAFAQILWALAFQWVALTGGDNGIIGLRPAAWMQTPHALYWLTLGVCIGGALVLRRILYAPVGYGLRAARDSPVRAEAIGLDAWALRIAAFVLAGAGAGLAGGLFAYAKGGVFPTYLGIGKSVEALVMVLLGGVQTMAGPLIGAVAYTGLYDLLLLATERWRAVLGAAIVLLVLVLPDGIAGTADRLWRDRRAA
jgi:branched-chain amino acid transport system permease protein